MKEEPRIPEWPLASDTVAALVKDRKLGCDSRSLLLDRFADPRRGDEKRRQFWKEFIETPACFSEQRQRSWNDFLSLLCLPEGLLFAELRSRMMVNMAGGVMENAGLCLDRFGLPYIPGSAVKGCARRAAIQELREALAHEKSNLLETIALVFGWVGEDWKDSSDFAYGCQRDWEEIRERTAESLWQKFRIRIDSPAEKDGERVPSNFAGTVRFLPAYPYKMPKHDLEKDILTPHHQEYYRGVLCEAFDSEKPIPVLFPAVAPGTVFLFPIRSAPRGIGNLLEKGRGWLREGLEKLGIGAKTAAGYGWFDCSERIQQDMQSKLAKEREERERAEKRAHLEPDPKELDALGKLKESDLRGQINLFAVEEKYWLEKDRKDEGKQFTLLYYLTVVNRELYEKEKGNPKSKVWKALHNLADKFGKTLP
ncbi:hypothetical protein MAMC_01279 [Methylacidimicrobium cyclopophantes]|uniref:CRISPR type III-associated protein domain-containing protein n=2 Tax=Methylacidimicrobium cyclopophantes TaxID=1041766 RepID=A0A5E6MCZ9_9BACT|nr:hypothetical protein MAMC_01279 [Methylacidimicrobium cyclopophantes]